MSFPPQGVSSLSPWTLTSGSPRVTPEGLLGTSLGHLTHARLLGTPHTCLVWAGAPSTEPLGFRCGDQPHVPHQPVPSSSVDWSPKPWAGATPEHGARPGRKAPRLSAGWEGQDGGGNGSGAREGSGRSREWSGVLWHLCTTRSTRAKASKRKAAQVLPASHRRSRKPHPTAGEANRFRPHSGRGRGA